MHNKAIKYITFLSDLHLTSDNLNTHEGQTKTMALV